MRTDLDSEFFVVLPALGLGLLEAPTAAWTWLYLAIGGLCVVGAVFPVRKATMAAAFAVPFVVAGAYWLSVGDLFAVGCAAGAALLCAALGIRHRRSGTDGAGPA